MTSKIEWTDETWNPLVGCAHISPGCDNCYAARETAGRLQHLPAYQGLSVRSPGEAARFTGQVRLLPDRLNIPLRWKRPRRVFVNSMSDLFHADVDETFIADVFAVMVEASRHEFQVLTKRPQRAKEILSRIQPDPAPNIVIGTSIESDRYTFRANHLRATPAATRFLSLEPLLGPLPTLDLTGIGWVIVGGESGPRARPMSPVWVRHVRDLCADADVPLFFKQWGEWCPVRHGLDPLGKHVVTVDGVLMVRAGKKLAGRVLDGAVHDAYPTGDGAAMRVVRLCCGEPHSGPVCDDGLVMCQHCFVRVPVAELNVDVADGRPEDVCARCAEQETVLLAQQRWSTGLRLVDDAVSVERERAHRKHGATSMRHNAALAERRFRILVEEVGEVAEAFNDNDHGKYVDEATFVAELFAELVQVAAMASDWAAAVAVEFPNAVAADVQSSGSNESQ